MKSPLFQQTASPTGPSAAAEEISFIDPWDALDEGRDKRDSWLLSYIDILTLFLTLFVVLLALTPKNEAPPVDAEPGALRFVAPEPIERRIAAPTATLGIKPQQVNETSHAPPDQPAIIDAEIDAEETVSGSVQPVFIAALLNEPIVPLIFMPPVVDPGPVNQDLQPKAADSAKDIPAPIADAKSSPEPAADRQPAAAESRRDQVQLFMTKLARQDLDDRVRVSEVAEGVYLEVSDNILFALGSAELKSAGAALLDELALLLLEHKGIVSVEGHTDDRPIATNRFPSNWELSSGRATTVTRYLIGKGLDPERLRAVGYADTRPLESNTSSDGRARNRRVALIVEIPEI